MRRPAGALRGPRNCLRHQVHRRKLFDECLDGGAVEPHGGSQIGSGQCAVNVQAAKQHRQVALSDDVLGGDARHRQRSLSSMSALDGLSSPRQGVDSGSEEEEEPGDDEFVRRPKLRMETRPRPPKSDVPPMTAAPTAYSRVFPLPASAGTPPIFDANATPAQPASVEQMANAESRIRATSIPARRAASAFRPTA